MPVNVNQALLDPGMNLTLRPMRYPLFYERFRDAIRNTWTVEEVDLHSDLADLHKLTDAERHLVNRLVAFFATGDTIVANNLVLNLYQHVNAPEARLYLSRQLFEEAVHVQFYLTLLDTYLPDEDERGRVRRGGEHPVHPHQGRVLLQVDRLDRAPEPVGEQAGPTRVPVEPDLLRRVHRGHPEQSLGIEAVDASTVRGVSTLVPGDPADLVLVGRDIADLPPSELREVPILATVLDGRFTYRA